MHSLMRLRRVGQRDRPGAISRAAGRARTLYQRDIVVERFEIRSCRMFVTPPRRRTDRRASLIAARVSSPRRLFPNPRRVALPVSPAPSAPPRCPRLRADPTARTRPTATHTAPSRMPQRQSMLGAAWQCVHRALGRCTCPNIARHVFESRTAAFPAGLPWRQTSRAATS